MLGDYTMKNGGGSGEVQGSGQVNQAIAEARGAPLGAAGVRQSPPPLDMGVRLRLSVMMFLQFAIWGAWFVLFVPYLKGKGFSDTQASALFGNMALGAILSTLIAGYVADRLMASERLMAIMHLIGAGLLYWMSQLQDPANDYYLLFGVTLAYALVYNPTLALANSISFSHIPDATRDFPGIRVLGTLGWIAVGFLVDFLFKTATSTASASNGPLLLAAGLSLILGLLSLFLPHTPPSGKSGEAIPFVKALNLFKDSSFAVFFIVSFVITIVLAFYYTFTSDYLQAAAGVTNTGSTMAIGQICELVLLPLLPIFLFRFGMKWVLAMGMLAWGIRYALFAFGGPEGLPFALVLLGVALHGICFDFFFAAGFIHVDNEAPKDIRASGQALFGFLTYGVGMWLGNLLSGQIVSRFTTETVDAAGKTVKVVDWHRFWLVPSAGVIASLLVFLMFFRMRPGTRNGVAAFAAEHALGDSHVPSEEPGI
jgi:nucleoside transporter